MRESDIPILPLTYRELVNKLPKEDFVIVPKIWGKEVWLVNCEYCGKLLCVNRGAVCSYHFHPQKKETFYCLMGQVALTIEGKDYMLNPFCRPKTIEPMKKHQFMGLTDAVILEVSTHHEDGDVCRITESRSANNA